MLSWLKNVMAITSPKNVLYVRDFVIAHVVGIGSPVLLFLGNLIVAWAESMVTHSDLWRQMLSPQYFLLLGIVATALTATIRMTRGGE